MKLQLTKETTERAVDTKGKETNTIKGVEYSIVNEKGEINGNVSITEYNTTFNFYGEEINISEWKEKVENLFNKKEEK